jgi:uncharacterized phage protein (TIGR01671 family)
MNRPIKFRFWGDFGDFNEEADTCEKEMLYGDRFHFFDHAPINNLFADKRFVVMQFTGLLDKNGKEIYEGDILKINLYNDEWKTKVRTYLGRLIIDVQGYDWNTTALSFLDDEAETEVIGNIYENPELLK